MPIRWKLAPLWLCFALTLPAPLAAADGRRTTKQMEALSSQEANRVLRQDLLSILEPIDKIRRGMFTQLRGVRLSTQPFGTEYKNVCRRDDVTLWYTKAPDSNAAADAPLQPYSIDASPVFSIIGAAKAKAGVGRDGDVWQPACNSAGGTTAWFGAKDAFHALQGALVLTQTLDALRGGRIKALPCTDIYPKGQSCEQAIIAVGTVSNITAVRSCPAKVGSICYAIDLGADTTVMITARGSEEEVAPGETMSVAVEQYITVT